MEAQFKSPHGLALTLDDGSIIVADTQNHAIRKIRQNKVTTVAGGNGEGYADGPGRLAQFSNPHSVAVDSSNNIYVADSENNRLRKIDCQGNVTTFAGSGEDENVDGNGTSAGLSFPCCVRFVEGKLMVLTGDCLRVVEMDGTVMTLCTEIEGSPESFAVDPNGDIYVVRTQDHQIIRQRDPRNPLTDTPEVPQTPLGTPLLAGGGAGVTPYSSNFTGDLYPLSDDFTIDAERGIMTAPLLLSHPALAHLVEFMKSSPGFPYEIVRCEAVLNPGENRVFLGQIEKCEAKKKTPAFQVKWDPEDGSVQEIERRKKYLEHYLSHEHNKCLLHHNRNVHIVRLYHGTNTSTAHSITQTGFAALATLDQGWFGRAIYCADNPLYAAQYCKPDPCLIISDCILFNPYVVIDSDAPQCDSPSEFRFYGKPPVRNFYSHIVPVVPCGILDYRPPRGGQEAEATEYAFFQENQIIPKILVYLRNKKGGVLPSAASETSSAAPETPSPAPATPSPDPSRHSTDPSGSSTDGMTPTPAQMTDKNQMGGPSYLTKPVKEWRVGDVIDWLSPARISNFEQVKKVIEAEGLDGIILIDTSVSTDELVSLFKLSAFGDNRKLKMAIDTLRKGSVTY
uniref:PARP catalytic domain-containing protein n=1 Tax=Arcella intermedia TaxID=1963864 RepID=A0A6B2KZI0_9EUKA